jgi:hypothetical protein
MKAENNKIDLTDLDLRLTNLGLQYELMTVQLKLSKSGLSDEEISALQNKIQDIAQQVGTHAKNLDQYFQSKADQNQEP